MTAWTGTSGTTPWLYWRAYTDVLQNHFSAVWPSSVCTKIHVRGTSAIDQTCFSGGGTSGEIGMPSGKRFWVSIAATTTRWSFIQCGCTGDPAIGWPHAPLSAEPACLSLAHWTRIQCRRYGCARPPARMGGGNCWGDGPRCRWRPPHPKQVFRFAIRRAPGPRKSNEFGSRRLTALGCGQDGAAHPGG